MEDPRYGELVYQEYGWGKDSELAANYWREIPNHSCSDSELGLATEFNDADEMYPLANSRETVSTWKKKFKCIDREDLVISGDFNSPVARQLRINFKMCTGADCAPVEEIKEWLSGKFIVLIHNQKRFDPRGFYENVKINESVIHFIPISS